MKNSTSLIRSDAINPSTDVIVDARLHPGTEQIRGAVRYDPKALLSSDHLVLPLGHDRTIAVYGDTEEMAAAIVERLRREGYEASVLEGGLQAWADEDLPLELLTQEQPIPGDPNAGLKLL